MSFKILLINKNYPNMKTPKCWSTKFQPHILLINKISISNFVDQQNVHVHYQLLLGGTAPPAVALAKFLAAMLNPKP